ncbi:MAG: YqgE/AlgH family protein [Polyangiaceae bacterium]
MSAALAPGFLIASPPLGDPNFERTVVLLAMHGPQGALGFVINRIAPLVLGEVMSLAGYGQEWSHASGPVHSGGPVEPGSGWVLIGDPKIGGQPAGAIDVSPIVRISSSREAFDKLASDLGPTLKGLADKGKPTHVDIGRRLVFLGYSGWGPNQLETEIAHGAWLPAPFDEKLLFDVELDRRWEAAHALIGVAPAMGMAMRTIGEA